MGDQCRALREALAADEALKRLGARVGALVGDQV